VKAVNVPSGVPSPQVTSTFQGLSGFGSVNEPRLIEVGVASTTDWLLGAVSEGSVICVVAEVRCGMNTTSAGLLNPPLPGVIKLAPLWRADGKGAPFRPLKRRMLPWTSSVT